MFIFQRFCKIVAIVPLCFASPFSLWAHPMGNFSVSHYSRLVVHPDRIQLEYALDLAEIPTFELLRDWKLEKSSARAELDRKAGQQAKSWLNGLHLTINGKPASLLFDRAELVIADGAGNLPILRITTQAHLEATGGKLGLEDLNYPDRAGWKEIVIQSTEGVGLQAASQGSRDASQALTQYPADPRVAPPQDVRAELSWMVTPALQAKQENARLPGVSKPAAPRISAIEQPKTSGTVSPATRTAQAAPGGAVVRGDFLSNFLSQRELTPWMIFVALCAAFVLGAAHALTPGHGKTIVAAYLVGSRGTLKHALFLGAMVTFTHTISVFALGLATLFLFRFIMPERLTQGLEVISGLSIVAIGGWMLYGRLRHGGHSHSPSHGHSHDHSHGHSHGHSHDHDHSHSHDHAHAHAVTAHTQDHTHDHVHAATHTHDHAVAHSHAHDHPHTHDHGVAATHSHAADHSHSHSHGHDHGPGGHSHMPEEISWAGLVALGASGGLVPCESALVLLLGAIALGRVALGLVLLVSFSLGLALVLMLIGVLVLYAKRLLPSGAGSRFGGFFRWVPVASAGFVLCAGLIMTGVSLGWVQSPWMIR